MRAERKDRRTLWTNELHDLFVATIDKLLQARLAITPKNIMRMMNDELKRASSSIQLSRLQVASHLQQHREVMKKREIFSNQVQQLACATAVANNHLHPVQQLPPTPPSSGTASPQPQQHYFDPYYEIVQEELPPTNLVSSSETNFVPASPNTSYYYNAAEVEVEADADLDRYLNINLQAIDDYYTANAPVQALPFETAPWTAQQQPGWAVSWQ